ncbi:MAG: universal stress protein [Elainellaceae cyanobacterium]
MFHKILVAIDNSEISQIVFAQALALASAIGAELMLLHVLSSEEEGSSNTPMIGVEYYPELVIEIADMQQKQWAAYENRGLEMLRSYAEQAAAAGVMAEFTQTFGSPGRMICAMGRTWGANLIMMGRRGHSGFSEMLLGSVSNYVLHHAPCSVLAVQGQIPANLDVAPIQQAAAIS